MLMTEFAADRNKVACYVHILKLPQTKPQDNQDIRIACGTTGPIGEELCYALREMRVVP